MALVQNTFDGGTNGATITEANSGGASGAQFSLVEILAGATTTYQTTAALHGSRGARITGNGAHAFLQHDIVSNNKLTMRFHVRFPSAPTANCQIYTPRHATNYIGGVNITTGMKFQVTHINGAALFTTTATLATNTWYRVEISHEVATATTGKISFKYFLGDNAVAAETFTTTTADLGTAPIVMYRLGKINNSGNTPMDLDSITFEAGNTALLGPHVQINVTPTADAGTGSNDVEPGSVITLDGSGSADSDGSIVSYAWTQTNGTPVTLSGTGAKRTFTAPHTLAGTTLGFRLTVTDNSGDTGTASVVHVVLPASERAAVNGAWVPVRLQTLSGVAGGAFGSQPFGTSPFGG